MEKVTISKEKKKKKKKQGFKKMIGINFSIYIFFFGSA